MLIFIKLNIKSFLVLIKNLKSQDRAYFIECTKNFKLYKFILKKFYNLDLKILNFKLIDLKDDNGELERIKIERVILFKVQEKIKSSINNENKVFNIHEKVY